MKVIDFVKKINHDSDDIPVEIKCGISDTVAVDKSLWHYAAHCGIEADRKISSITICKNQITIYIKGAETPARASAGDRLPAPKMAGEKGK